MNSPAWNDTTAPGPGPIEGPQAWYGPEIAARDDWRYELTRADIATLETALARATARSTELLDLGIADFPLGGLGERLRTIRREVLHGRGLFLLRGLPVERYDIREAATLFWGIGQHLGEPVSQNGKGHVLGHVRNLGLDYRDPAVRGYQTSARLPYHSDSSDVVALLCLQSAQSGGLSSVVSSTTLWNEMVRRRPDLAAVLMQPLCRTRWGEIPAGYKRYARFAVFKPCTGRMICTYVRSAINKAQAFEETPRLTEIQIEAMDFLDALAADPALHLDMRFEPGDIQVLCNHSMLHSRTAYEDRAEPHRRRHLLRLWLACDDGPELPTVMTEEYQESTASGRPNGIRVPGVPFVAPLDAA